MLSSGKAVCKLASALGCIPFWRETFPTLDTLHPFPSCAGVERRLRAFAPRRRDGVRGRPPLWPAGDPVAEGEACAKPVVSLPVRRPDARGCSPPSVACRSFRRFGQACQVPGGIEGQRRTRRNPFHGRGRAAKGQPCGFLGLRSANPLVESGHNSLPAAKCRIENNHWADFLHWRACRAASQPKKLGRTCRAHPVNSTNHAFSEQEQREAATVNASFASKLLNGRNMPDFATTLRIRCPSI